MEMKLEVLPVPVTDVDRAKAFYADRVGFEVDLDDSPSEGFRLVQLTPPGSGCSIMIGTGAIDTTPGSVRGVQLVVDDVQAARDELAGRGVDVTEVRHFADGEWRPGKGGPWNAFAFFDDPDGNGWVLQERFAGDTA
jgi:catechol 2,3-dioxygenase-like lactoylglutathione lyase family enzyme